VRTAGNPSRSCLSKQGMTERLLTMQTGLTPDDTEEFEAARNALPLEKPQPEGYLIPGETDQKWSNEMTKQHDYSEVTYQPGVKRGKLSVYVGLDVVTHPKHALAQGALLKTAMTPKNEGLEIRGLVVAEKGEREDGIITVGLQKNSPYTPLRFVKGGCRLDLPHFSCASASHTFDEDTGEHVWMVRNEDIALKTRQPQEKPTAPAPQGPTLDPVTEVWTPAPDPADINAAFRGAVQAIIKAGDLLNRRHYFLADDGVTKVWVDGSSLGYEQLTDPEFSQEALLDWLESKSAYREAYLLIKENAGPMKMDDFGPWLIAHRRGDLAKVAMEELKWPGM
jgi:hypothetical protein